MKYTPPDPRRRLLANVATTDADACLRFISDNLCAVASLEEHAAGGGKAIKGPLRVDGRSHSAGGFSIAKVKLRAKSFSVSRSAAEIQNDSERRYGVYLPLSGNVHVEQKARAESCSAGSIVMLSGSEPFTLTTSGTVELLILMLPSEFVDARLIYASDLSCRQVLQADGLKALLYGTAKAFEESTGKIGEADLLRAMPLVAEMAVALVAKLIVPSRRVSPVRSARLLRAKRVIWQQCKDPDLTPPKIAKMCGFSLRYIHDLFRDEGCTLRDYLMHERLQCARTMLEAGDKTVTDVCMAAGFTSLSHFSTAFRREFSIPPSKVRRGDARDARR